MKHTGRSATTSLGKTGTGTSMGSQALKRNWRRYVRFWAVICRATQSRDGGIRAEPDGALQAIETKLEDAAWGTLWQGGEDFLQACGEALEPITREAFRKVLKRQRSGKAKGAGG